MACVTSSGCDLLIVINSETTGHSETVIDLTSWDMMKILLDLFDLCCHSHCGNSRFPAKAWFVCGPAVLHYFLSDFVSFLSHFIFFSLFLFGFSVIYNSDGLGIRNQILRYSAARENTSKSMKYTFRTSDNEKMKRMAMKRKNAKCIVQNKLLHATAVTGIQG